MQNPTLIALLIALLLLGIWVFIPGFGLLAILARAGENRERERIEDALKHLLVGRWENIPTNTASLKAALNLSDHNVYALIEKMTEQKLLEPEAGGLGLTAEGERMAIQIVRAHRLLEKYLADEARMPLNEIHRVAHRREHKYTEEEVDMLDAFLGHPLADPHGDPIPAKDGSVVEIKRIPLTAMETDQIGRVVHIEDEPEIAFAQIQAEGIQVGQTLSLIERKPSRLILTDGVEEYILAPAIAENVHITSAPELRRDSAMIRLHQLGDQQVGEIIELDPTLQGFTRRRMLDLGLTPGSQIYPELKNAFGDPHAYRIRGTLIALRHDQAENIWVKPVAAKAHNKKEAV